MLGNILRMSLLRWLLAIVVMTMLTVGYWAAERTGFAHRANVLKIVETTAATVMEFPADFSVDELPPGWHHRKFLSRTPMNLTAVEKEGARALQCHTQGSASMLVRYIDANLTTHPQLEWRWMVTDGVDSPVDERTEEGDDHPIRLFLRFVNGNDEKHAMEIIWGNVHLKSGEWKYLGTFPHYVANGGAANIGRWHNQSVDLRALYAKNWGDAAGVRLTEIALFCDSDEVGDSTTAYLEYVRLAGRSK